MTESIHESDHIFFRPTDFRGRLIKSTRHTTTRKGKFDFDSEGSKTSVFFSSETRQISLSLSWIHIMQNRRPTGFSVSSTKRKYLFNGSGIHLAEYGKNFLVPSSRGNKEKRNEKQFRDPPDVFHRLCWTNSLSNTEICASLTGIRLSGCAGEHSIGIHASIVFFPQPRQRKSGLSTNLFSRF
jgi:hypothetical protein